MLYQFEDMSLSFSLLYIVHALEKGIGRQRLGVAESGSVYLPPRAGERSRVELHSSVAVAWSVTELTEHCASSSSSARSRNASSCHTLTVTHSLSLSHTIACPLVVFRTLIAVWMGGGVIF